MMISSYVVRNLCGYFVITCWKHTADKQINQQDFNTARARTITSFQVPPQHCLFQIQPGISWVRKYSFHPNLETSEYPIYSSFFLSLSHNITDSKNAWTTVISCLGISFLGIFVVICEAAAMQIRSKSHCMAQIWPLHLLAYTSLTAPKTEAYFFCTLDLRNSI